MGYALENKKCGQTRGIIFSKMRTYKGFNHALFLLTTVCPIECEHCQYSCTLQGTWMPDETLLKSVKECKLNGIESIHISGGEPFFDIPKLKNAIKIISEYYPPTKLSIATSGFWAVNEQETRNVLKIIYRLGIKKLYLSFDRFHFKQISLEHIENILKTSPDFEIEIVLRPALDKCSGKLFGLLEQTLKKYGPNIIFSYTEPFGRGELLDKDALLSVNASIRQFISDFKQNHLDKCGEKIGSKNIHLNHPNPLSVTFFPTGDIYGCCILMKLTYMGNLNNKNLKTMLEEYKNTIPGYSLFKNGDCSFFRRLNHPDVKDRCNICRNQPFTKEVPTESVGRDYALIKDFNKVPESKKELLLAFKLAKNDLNPGTGKKIILLLKKLDQNKQRFRISRPLPRCLFNKHEYASLLTKYSIPKNCFECEELFTVKNGYFFSCDHINEKGPELDTSLNRAYVWNFFNNIRLKKEPPAKCKGCLYFKRKNCDGLCFRS